MTMYNPIYGNEDLASLSVIKGNHAHRYDPRTGLSVFQGPVNRTPEVPEDSEIIPKELT